MKKRIHALLVVLCLVLNMVSGVAFSADIPYTCDEDHEGHTHGEVVVTKEATCIEEGTWVVYCTDEDCGIVLHSGTIPMLPHEPEKQPCENDYVEPTCTEEGHDYTHCAACKTLIKEVDGKWVVATEAECTIPALGHEYETFPAKDPTCTEPGHNEYRICTRVIDEEGTICGAYEPGHEKEEIPATGHGEPEAPKGYAPKCDPDADDENSYDYSVDAICPICQDYLENQIVVPAPHTWVEKEGLEPTCTEPGYESYRECSVCGRIEGKNEIEPTGHSWKYYGALAGSCTEPGRHAGYKCSVCGVTDPDRPGYEDIPAPGHTEDIILEGKEPTCTEPGLTEGKQCSVCGEITVEQEEIPAKGHDWKTVIGKKATCTEDGEGAHSLCKVCGEKQYVDPDVAIIPAHGHSNENGYYPEDGKNEHPGEERDYRYDGYNDTWITEEEAAMVKAATCTEDGYKANELCSFCNEVLVEGGVQPKLGHDWELTVEGTLPTCTKEGISDEWNCKREGCDEHKGGEVINAIGHQMVEVEELVPDCVNPGHFAYEYCSVCGFASNEKYLDEEGNDYLIDPILEAHGYDAFAIAKVETKQDLDDLSIIPAEYVIRAYACAYYEAVKPLPATCTEDGIAEGATRCLVCNEIENLILIPATGHAVHVEEGYEADCLNDGLKDYIYCGYCGNACEGVFEEPEAAQEALTNATVVMPEEGHPEEFIIAALGHDEKPGVAKDPTCHEAGHTAGLYCDRCGLTLETSEELEKLEHQWEIVEEAIEPTCTEDGKTAVEKCTLCEIEGCEECVRGGEVIPATGHGAGNVTPAKAPTCTEYGYTIGIHCSKCEVNYEPVFDYLLNNNIDVEELYEAGWLVVPKLVKPLGHEMGEEKNGEPTCEEEGYDNYSECQREGCDHSEGEIKPALGHDWLDVPGGDNTAPTCTEAGTDGIHQCARCKKTEAVIIPALGHDWVHYDAVDATCAAPGNIEYDQCSRCGLYLVEGVEYDEYDVVVEDDGLHDKLVHVDEVMPTCCEDGHTAGQYCEVCEYFDWTVLEANAEEYHKYLEDNKEALLEDGTLEWTITSEGDGTPGSGMEAILCPCGCGHIVDVRLYPEVKLGDVNMDGKVNSIDALMILQYKAGVIDTLPNKVAADFNVDGNINSIDALGILNSKIN